MLPARFARRLNGSGRLSSPLHLLAYDDSSSRTSPSPSSPSPPSLPPRRAYHATARREILPFIAVGAVGFVGYYSYRAVQRMSAEREEYEEYLVKFGHVDDAAEPAVKVLGVDFGTSSLRCAISSPKGPEIVEDREGGRSTPSYIYHEDGASENGAGEEAEGGAVVGRMAQQKLYAGPQAVQSPWKMLSADPSEASSRAAGLVLRDVIVNAIDKKAAGSIGAVEGVLCYDPSFTPEQREALVSAASIAGLIDPYVVAGPVGAVIAAEHFKIITPEEKEKPVIVCDFGHSVASFSVVKDNKLLATTSAALGGETLQNLLVSHLGSKFLKSTSLDVTADPMALQRLHDAAAQMVAELSNKTRADADLPYITADAGGPKHLLETVSRQVLEQMLDEAVGSLGLLKDAAFGTDAAAVVVNHLMDNLTAAKLTPADLGAVVLAGGASRAPAYAGAVRRAVNLLGGEDWGNKTLRVVEGELADELNVQGAALSLK